MTRDILDAAHIHPAIRETIASNHADIVREVQAAVANNDVVVVGKSYLKAFLYGVQDFFHFGVGAAASVPIQ